MKKNIFGNETEHICGRVNWEQIRCRMESVRRALAKASDPRPEENRQILKARAESLAKKDEISDADEACLQVVVFLLARETYGIELVNIREVCFLKEITPIPSVPAFVAGIIAFRGQILSLIDLKKIFNLPEGQIGKTGRVIVLHSKTMEFGILADEVIGVKAIPLSRIQGAATYERIGTEYLKGITPERMAILDGRELLSDKKLVVYQEV